MRKKKETLRRRTMPPEDEQVEEVIENELEQRYEEISGETSTEGVGPGYTTDTQFEESVESADGPLSNESMTPPESEPKVRESKQVERRRKNAEPLPPGRHSAARSSRKI
jgi:hypothetical protein